MWHARKQIAAGDGTWLTPFEAGWRVYGVGQNSEAGGEDSNQEASPETRCHRSGCQAITLSVHAVDQQRLANS
jgi:hypothetical protein